MSETEKVDMEKLPRFLPSCHKEAEKLDIIFTCSGAASVGKIGHEVGFYSLMPGKLPAYAVLPQLPLDQKCTST